MRELTFDVVAHVKLGSREEDELFCFVPNTGASPSYNLPLGVGAIAGTSSPQVGHAGLIGAFLCRSIPKVVVVINDSEG